MSPALTDLHAEAARLAALLRNTGAAPAAMADILAAAVAAEPANAAARLALCATLWDAGDHEAAIAHYRVLAEQHPSDPAPRLALGLALVQTRAWSEGAALLDSLGDALPDQPGLHEWHARALWALGRHDDAIRATVRAVALAPGVAQLQFDLAWRRLALGQWREAWPGFAWRWHLVADRDVWRRPADPLAPPDPAQWRGRTVLLHVEQGNGDTIQCLRYLPLVRAAGARAILEVQPGLVRLVQWMAGDTPVVAMGEPLPPFDLAIPLFHLPWAFATTPATVPGRRPYLAAHPADIARWRDRLAGLHGLRVGLVWAGNAYRNDPDAHALDRERSASLADLTPLAAVPGVDFVSLQVGEASAQAAAPPPGMALHDWTAELHDFADTAALMTALDLVIAVDTGPMHLAAALGRPVWLMNRHDGCWRWLRDRDDSPWYPSLRQFRQATPGDWHGVATSMARALEALVSRT
jgi:hypothetical protein